MRQLVSLLASAAAWLLLMQNPATSDDGNNRGLVNLNLRINRLNLTRLGQESGRKNPFFFNLDIPNIFKMNLDTKRDEGTSSLGLRVLQPINRFLRMFGIDTSKEQQKDSNGWSLRRRSYSDDQLSEMFLRRSAKAPTTTTTTTKKGDQSTTAPTTTTAQQP